MNIIDNGVEFKSGFEYSNMIQIEGTEKQVEWAEEIRAKFVRELNNLIKKAGKQINANRAADIEQAFAAQGIDNRIDAVFANASAEYWINNRSAMIQQLLAAI